MLATVMVLTKLIYLSNTSRVLELAKQTRTYVYGQLKHRTDTCTKSSNTQQTCTQTETNVQISFKRTTNTYANISQKRQTSLQTVDAHMTTNSKTHNKLIQIHTTNMYSSNLCSQQPCIQKYQELKKSVYKSFINMYTDMQFLHARNMYLNFS